MNHNWIPALALAAGACGGDRVGQPHHIDSLPLLRTTVEQRFGSSAHPDSGFSYVISADVDHAGNLYVLDAMDRAIRVFDGKLRLVSRIGRWGTGPGEFQEPPTFGVEGDTVWAISSAGGGASRLAIFSRGGTLLSTATANAVRINLPSSYGYVRPYRMRPDGRFTSDLTMVGSMRGDPPTGVKPTDSIPVPRVLFGASGTVLDTIGWDDKPPPRMWRPPGAYDSENHFQIIRHNDRPYLVPDPPTTMPAWHALHDGRISIETPQPARASDTSFFVVRVNMNRDTIYSSSLYYTPRPWSEEELLALARGASEGMGGYMEMGSGPPQPKAEPDAAVARLIREKMKFPGFKLPIEYSWVSADESVWLRRDDSDERGAKWILLSPDGTPRGQLDLAARARILWHKGDDFWAAEPDSLDVPWLVRYRISTGGERR